MGWQESQKKTLLKSGLDWRARALNLGREREL